MSGAVGEENPEPKSSAKKSLKRSNSRTTKLTKQFSVNVYTDKDLELKGDSIVASIAYGPCFLNLTIVVIVLNAIWMLIDVEWNHSTLRGADGRRPLQDLSVVLENCFCSFFSVEILIRLFGFRRWRFMFKDAWFLFDISLVILMVLENWVLPLLSLLDPDLNSDALDSISLVRLFRLLRLGRIFRMLRFHPEMRLLVKSIARAMNAVFNILFLLVLVTYLFAIIFTSQLGVPGTEPPNPDLSEATAQQLFADLGSSMLSLFTHGVLADELAFAILLIDEDSIILFWLFTLFVVISGITLLNMLIGVLCQVVEDNSREHEKQQILVDLKTSLEDAFNALDTSHDGKVSEEEFLKMRADPNVINIFVRLGMEESAIIQRLNHMQETIFAAAKGDDVDESFMTDSRDPASARRPASLSFSQFCDQVIELQMNNAAGVLDVQMLASKVRAEDKQIQTMLKRLEPDVRRLLNPESQETPTKTLSSLGMQTLTLTGEDSTPVRFPSGSMGPSLGLRSPGEASQPQLMPMKEEGEEVQLPGVLHSPKRDAAGKASPRRPSQDADSAGELHVEVPREVPRLRTFLTQEGLELREDWLQEVPTELILYILKSRYAPEVIT
mmetsp:Transcript_10298/g.24758  ORF Transcript_10298/g.24758 Transcript_10298/m.24758 type:complete len:612 (-) Transcript_10298:230-2065(-)